MSVTDGRHHEDYYRRRIDDITDDRLTRVDNRLGHVEARLARLEGRINYLFGVLGVLVVVANFIAPVLLRTLFP